MKFFFFLSFKANTLLNNILSLDEYDYKIQITIARFDNGDCSLNVDDRLILKDKSDLFSEYRSINFGPVEHNEEDETVSIEVLDWMGMSESMLSRYILSNIDGQWVIVDVIELTVS